MVKEIAALKVHQWYKEWDQVSFSDQEYRKKPEPYFYVFSISANVLKRLSGIRRRSTDRTLDSPNLGIQRRHDPQRSNEIKEYKMYGYPWSDLSDAKRKSGEYDDLRKPGWLPTAIVINILKGQDLRDGYCVDPDDLVHIQKIDGGIEHIQLPERLQNSNERPKTIYPIEVIDGQHRLWAFDEADSEENDKYELPVVAFHGLDISWQAYLFWTINIKPKRINPSLAFDLYPLLRTEDWLEKFEGHSIYRETRAQELIEALWAYPQSVWFHRINMLGESKLDQPMVTQAAWIRSLMASFIKPWSGQRVNIGGLFGSKMREGYGVLIWSRSQQAAFLILVGQLLEKAIKESQASWVQSLRNIEANRNSEQDAAFFGKYTLLNSDQGIRVFLQIVNDLCFVAAHKSLIDLTTCFNEDNDLSNETISEQAIDYALLTIKEHSVAAFLESSIKEIAAYDWRISSTPGLSEEERLRKAGFRGSGGYKELRTQLLFHLKQSNSLGELSENIITQLGYN